MANMNDEKAMLLQNLQDAGCDGATIECCMCMANESADIKMLPLLQKFRTCLLDEIHKEQGKLESLDYLIYQLKKKQNERNS